MVPLAIHDLWGSPLRWNVHLPACALGTPPWVSNNSRDISPDKTKPTASHLKNQMDYFSYFSRVVFCWCQKKKSAKMVWVNLFFRFGEGVTHLWEIGHRDGWFVEQLEFSAHVWAEIPCLVYLFRKLSSSFLTWYSEPSKHLLIQDQNPSSEQRKSDKSDFPSSIDYISWGCNLPFLPVFCHYVFFSGNVETKLPPLHSSPISQILIFTLPETNSKSSEKRPFTPKKETKIVFQQHPFSGANLQLQGG